MDLKVSLRLRARIHSKISGACQGVMTGRISGASDAMTSDSEKIIGIYNRHARLYAHDRGTALMEKAWLDRFLAGLGERPSILDIGCGSGDPMARYLIAEGARLTGVDSSPELLAMCRAKFPEQRWIEADMRTLSLGERYDGILAWDSFFHLSPDAQRRMFPVFRDHTTSGSNLMFTSGTSYEIAVGEYRGEPLYHASLDPAEYQELLVSNGFEVGAYVERDPLCGQHTIWLARRT